MSRIKGLIFDLDGTIIDNDERYMELMLSRVGKELGRSLTLDHARQLWYSMNAVSRDEVISRWGLDPDEFWAIFNTFENLQEKLNSTYLHKDAPFLKSIDLPKSIVTHTTYDHTDNLLKLVGMRDLFNPIISCTEDLGFKPSPLPLIHCVVNMKLTVDEVIFVGDTISDMLAAKDAGIKSVYINRFKRPIDYKPDYEIDSLEKIAEIIK
ncbi:HAD family hydrolase [Methanocella sp. CWC-04]|uniref:HAD family hydrolase n=1 Tax=Methanooceanicella nereidis TaxID=2052831 RepID=A0AAP2R9I0_9EURY|nr:HAD family hydrolase [Methanocella sp. CWC-04]MCD1293461.1 HAD family hydrolase [Methanocella sp. CWC-04]